MFYAIISDSIRRIYKHTKKKWIWKSMPCLILWELLLRKIGWFGMVISTGILRLNQLILYVDTLPQIKSFMRQCLHNSIGVGDCLVKRQLSELDRCPICLTKLRLLFIDFGTVRWSKQLGSAWVFSQTAASLRIASPFGLRRIANLMGVECPISHHGEFFFLLSFGCCGKKGIMWCLEATTFGLVFTVKLCFRRLSFCTVCWILKFRVAEGWFGSDGRSLHLVGFA